MKLRKPRAFSLIELIVVMVLIGIVSSFAGANFLEFQRKQALSESAQIVSTTLAEAFSSARSRGLGFVVEVQKDQNFIDLKKCDDKTCLTISPLRRIKFPPKIKVDFTDPTRSWVEIKYKQPHGDIEAGSGDVVEIKLKHEKLTETKTLFIYTKSGLIEIKNA